MDRIRQVNSEGHKKWLSDDLILWRYVPLKTLFFYLSGNIFIPSIEKLRQSDPFEGEFYFNNPWFNSAMKERYGANLGQVEKWMIEMRCNPIERNLIENGKSIPENPDRTSFAGGHNHCYFDFIRKTRYAWCWFQANEQSAAMWNIYGAHGAAIATSVGRLRKALNTTERNFVFGRMTYVSLVNGKTELNAADEQINRHILEPYFLKRNEYESENEVRFITLDHEDNNRYFGGVFLKNFAPNEWIEKILFWPKTAVSESESLIKVVERISPGIPCARSDLLSTLDESTGVLMHSLFSEYNDQKWRNGQDGIPSELKQL